MCSCTHSLKELQIWKKLQYKREGIYEIYNRTQISIPKDNRPMKQQSYKQIFHLYSQCLTSLNE